MAAKFAAFNSLDAFVHCTTPCARSSGTQKVRTILLKRARRYRPGTDVRMVSGGIRQRQAPYIQATPLLHKDGDIDAAQVLLKLGAPSPGAPRAPADTTDPDWCQVRTVVRVRGTRVSWRMWGAPSGGLAPCDTAATDAHTGGVVAAGQVGRPPPALG